MRRSVPGITPSQLLRRGLLDGVGLLLAGAAPFSAAAEESAVGCEQLGAQLARVAIEPGEDPEPAVRAALAPAPAPDVLLLDAAGLFRAGGAVARAAMGQCLQLSWELTRAVANAALLEPARGGRIVYIAPAPADEWARAARAGLENLARTLSIEFSSHTVTTVCLAPGERTGADELAALVGYLASPAGAYFSGCLVDLSGNASASRASERAR